MLHIRVFTDEFPGLIYFNTPELTKSPSRADQELCAFLSNSIADTLTDNAFIAKTARPAPYFQGLVGLGNVVDA